MALPKFAMSPLQKQIMALPKFAHNSSPKSQISRNRLTLRHHFDAGPVHTAIVQPNVRHFKLWAFQICNNKSAMTTNTIVIYQTLLYTNLSKQIALDLQIRRTFEPVPKPNTLQKRKSWRTRQ